MNHPDEPTEAMSAAEFDPEVEPGPDPERTPATTTEPPTGNASSGPSPLVWIASGALVIAVVAGIVWFAVTTSRENREAAMRGVATGYLTAIAEADAGAALERLAEPPANTTLLTDEVLASSREAAPLTDIAAGALSGTETAPTVAVTYRLGDEPVETTIVLSPTGGSWKIADGTVDLTIPERRSLSVNGATVTEEVTPVFPGTYTATATSDKVALTGTPTLVVTTPDQTDANLDVTVGLSELGTQTVLGAVKGRFDECLTATESRPANCPFGVSTDGVEVAPGSVKFALVNDPWAAFAPTLDPATLVASGTLPIQVNATATVTRDGLTADATTTQTADRGYAVDLTKDPAVVTWS